MASSRTIASRLSPRLSSLSSNHLTNPSPSLSQLTSSAPARVPRSISRVVRLPVELTSAMSLMPLHSAIASSLMQSSLAVESWRLVNVFMTFCCCCPVDDAEVFC